MIDDDDEPRRWPISDELTVDLNGPSIVFKDGAEAGLDGDYDLGVLPEHAIRPLRIVDLGTALLAIDERDGEWPIDAWLIDTDSPNRIHDVEPLDGIVLHSGGRDGLSALVAIGLPRHADESFEARTPTVLGPMMERLGAESQAHYHAPETVFPGEFIVQVEFKNAGGRLVGDLMDLAKDVQALLRACRLGKFHRAVARDLLRAGHGSVLLGQPESGWLEAKSQGWDLNTPAGKAEASKDLSAFANADGGMLVIPAKTVGDGSDESISAVKAYPLDRFSETQLRDTLAHWVFPRMEGVEIDLVDRGDGRGLILINVPRARDELWPHLVVGDDKAAFPSAAIAAYVRDGAKNRALTADELHRLLQTSRLRRDD